MGGDYSKGNYLVGEKIDEKLNKGASIPRAGEWLALLLFQGDRDALGSKGQNKKLFKGKLFGIDFGNSFRKENKAVASMKDDFSFTQPDDVFKNFSMFDDCPLSEKMAGFHYLRKLATGKMPSDEVLDSFPKHVREQLENIEGNSLFQIFEQYRSHLEELKGSTWSKSRIKQLDQMIKAVDKRSEHAVESWYKMQETFKDRMNYTKEELDFVENLEKLTSKTSLRSLDNTMLLNHIRVDKRVPWDMKKAEDGSYEFTIRSEDQLMINDAKRMLEQSGLDFNIQTPFENIIQIEVTSEHFIELSKILNEDFVKKFKHPADQRLQSGAEKTAYDPTKKSKRTYVKLSDKIKKLISKKKPESAEIEKKEPREAVKKEPEKKVTFASRIEEEEPRPPSRGPQA